MPSICRPAPSTAAAARSTISRRTATTTTRVRRPAGVVTTPSGWKSSTASSIGIGMWSGAVSRTAAASALGSSLTTARSSVRTTMRWWAIPSRTRLGSSCSAKRVLSASARAIGSATSPSRMTPGRSSATAPRVRVMPPAAVTSAAATWPGSSSSPTTWFCAERFLRNTGLVSVFRRSRLSPLGCRPQPGLNARSGPEGPLRGEEVLRVRLPGGGAAVVGAAAGAAGGAGAGDAAVGRAHDLPHAGVRALRGHVDLVGGLVRRDGQAVAELRERRLDVLQRGADAGGASAVGVVLLVGVERLERRLSGTGAGLGLGVLSLLALVQERGQRDRGKDADDQDHDQELDEREALLVLHTRAKLVKHCG